MNIKAILTVLSIAFLALSCNEVQVSEPSVIPQPVQMNRDHGTFTLTSSATIKYTGDEYAAGVAGYLAELLRPATGFSLETTEGVGGAISLVIDTLLEWQPEQYRLTVEKKKVTLTACTPAGLSRGIQTLRQLLPAAIQNPSRVDRIKWTVPCVTVTDYPRFAWRGMHLDVSRHFFDVSFVKRYIDILAFHKMNVFHWHLVDDQGWRIEIKKYPMLTEVGAWRVDREDKPWTSRPAQQPGEKATYGGYYTQEEIKEIVAYAAERHINVVPEIEMPAHVGSVLAAYPEYSCTGGPFTVPPGSVWPITDIYCAGKEETFGFLEDVLTEVMELFPSPYIHIGGDEADKTEWRKCPLCQARMKKEGLKDEAELQSYFVKRMETFISSKGRHLIGWDEILEGGLAPGAAVMSWQGFDGGVAAAKSGHNAVMTPVSHCYFNIYQGDPSDEPESFRGLLTLNKVYSFEPVPAELTPGEAEQIIGAQGCLWTEYVTDGKTAEYMVLPRLTALSEVVWSAPGSRNWEGFSTRLLRITKHYDAMGLSYSKGSFRVDMTASYNDKTNSISLEMTSEQHSPEIRYTTNGSDPDSSSPIYESPLPLNTAATVKAAIFAGGKMMGKVNEKKVTISKSTGKSVTYNLPYSNRYKGFGNKTLVNGIMGSGLFDDGQWQGFEGNDMDIVIDLGTLTPVTRIGTRFMAATGSWVFLPQWVEVMLSEDGISLLPSRRIETSISPADQGNEIIDYITSFPETEARFIRIVAKTQGMCPPWHPGAGGKAWLFCDEVVID